MKNFIRTFTLLGVALVIIGGAFALPAVSVNTAQATGDPVQVVTSCDLTADATTVANNGSVKLSWETEGFDEFRLNGQPVSGASGSKTFTNVTVNTAYTFVATNDNGDRCQSTIDVQCLPPVAKVCEPGDQNYHPKADLTGSIYAEGKGRVVNSSEYCDYKVGLASYEKFDEIIDNQKLFDSATGIVKAKSTLEGAVSVPNCKYQIDLFYGDVLTSLDGQRYGERKLDYAHLNSNQQYCGVPVPVKECKLDIHKTVDKQTAKVGDEITYTITVKNTGDANCTGSGVKIYDVVDGNLTYRSHTLTSNLTAGYINYPVYSSSDRTLRFNGNDLVPGESGTITWVGKVSGPTQCGDFAVKNQAKTTAIELNNFKTWVYSDTVTTDIDNDCVIPVKECKLDIHKTVDKQTAKVGDEITYTITVKNTGDANCTGGGVKIYDVVDGNLTYKSHTLTSNLTAGYGNQPVYSSSDRTLRFNGNVLTPGESGTITWVGKVSGPTQCGDFAVKNQAKTTAVELNNFQTWVYSDTVKTDINNDCDVPVKPQCPYTSADGVLVDFGDARIFSNRGEANSRSAAQAVNLPAGKYDVRLVAWDGYEGRQTVTQPNEKYRVVLTNGSGVITQSNNTQDLTDYVKTALFDGKVNSELSVAANVTNVYAQHSVYPDSSSPNSLAPICAVFTPKVVKPLPSCDSFSASPTSFAFGGGDVTLKWETTNATNVSISGVGNNLNVDNTVGRVVSVPTTQTFVLTATNSEGEDKSCVQKVTVLPKVVKPLPKCDSFKVSPTSFVFGGGDVTLKWETTNATNVSISGIGDVNLDNTTGRVVSVPTTRTFVLTATNSEGTDNSCVQKVTVGEKEPVFTCANNVNFSVSDSSIQRGETVNLTWSTVNVDSLSISSINATALAGSQSVSPSSDTTYTLRALNGTKTIDCPVPVSVSSGGGGGGGGSRTPRCDLDISDKSISRGEEITLRWDTSYAKEITIKDDRGKTIFTTADYLSKDKKKYLDGSIKVKPTRNTQYTLVAERGSRDRECEVKVKVDDTTVVLENRDQQPLVAGISLTQVPYTGFEAGPFMTSLFYALLVAWSLFITYLLVIRNRVAPASIKTFMPSLDVMSNRDLMKQAESRRPDVFAPSVMSKVVASQTTPTNLPTGFPVAGQDVMKFKTASTQSDQATDTEVTAIENRAHSQKALLSSDAVRYFIASTEGSAQREEALDQVTAEAKKTYPLEDGWIVINQARMQSLCETCTLPSTEEKAAPATVPTGTGSLAEAIVTGNVVAAYQMIGHRPMFALADAAADLDAVYRNRKGGSAEVSQMLTTETQNLSDEQISEMITALTGALDGTYTDEASAVKMSIMKAVKIVA